MSVTAVSTLNVPQSPPPAITRRHGEDYYGRQLEQALQSGDLAGAQQAYDKLATFGPNNSGPFRSPVLRDEFQALGQAIQSGDLTGAQQAVKTLGSDLLKQDMQAAIRDFRAGGWSNAQQAIANLRGDYWAVNGNPLPQPSQGAPAGGGSTGAPPDIASGINVTA